MIHAMDLVRQTFVDAIKILHQSIDMYICISSDYIRIKVKEFTYNSSTTRALSMANNKNSH